MNNNNLSVRLYKSMNIPETTEDGKEPIPGTSERFINVEVAYTPNSCSKLTKEEKLNNENFDRDWFSTLIGMNPTIDNLGVVVDSAAKAMIDSIKPENVSMAVTISGSSDKNGFCTKSVQFFWEKENE